MRGKSSPRVKAAEPAKPEPQLSGAYIRSLVKHLSSSMPKDQAMIISPKSPNSTLDETQPSLRPQPPHPPKKQVRRRLHTSRPYQERLLNMAEARREIVTALKFHRASMKQKTERQQQQQRPLPPRPSPNPIPSPDMYQQNLSLSWFAPPPPPNISDTFNFPLPNQPLGLNLNFQGFTNIDTPMYYSNPIKDAALLPLSPHSSSSSSYSYSSPPICSMEAQAVPIEPGDARLRHPVMDEKEMEEIRSIGEKHDMEWNDTVNLVTSAWWSEFLDKMEGGSPGEIPAWLQDGSAGHFVMQQNMDDEYYLHDASLPW